MAPPKRGFGPLLLEGGGHRISTQEVDPSPSWFMLRHPAMIPVAVFVLLHPVFVPLPFPLAPIQTAPCPLGSTGSISDALSKLTDMDIMNRDYLLNAVGSHAERLLRAERCLIFHVQPGTQDLYVVGSTPRHEQCIAQEVHCAQGLRSFFRTQTAGG